MWGINAKYDHLLLCATSVSALLYAKYVELCDARTSYMCLLLVVMEGFLFNVTYIYIYIYFAFSFM